MKVKIGSRWSIHRTILFCWGGAAMAGLLADLDGGVGEELIDRHLQIARRRTPADAAGRVVLRAMAGADPAAILAARIGRLLPERHAAEMRADADHDQPFALLGALGVGLRILQRRQIDAIGRLN